MCPGAHDSWGISNLTPSGNDGGKAWEDGGVPGPKGWAQGKRRWTRLLDGKGGGAGRCPEEWQDPGKDGNLVAPREAEAGPEKELRSPWFK